MMRPTLTISARTCPALLLAALATGCGVSQEAYDKAIDGAHRARIEASQRGAEVTALRAQVYRLAADLQDRDVRLSDATTAQAGMIRKLDELALLNAELSERLRKAGQSVAELAGERGSLSAALAETRARLEELARQQAAAEARAAQFRDLAARFQRMIDAGQLRVAIRDGRMLIELPNDVLFDSAKTDIKPAGRAALVEIAGVLAGMPGRKLQVAGHTDNVKIKGNRFASNWELSTARALAVVKLLVESGVPPESLSAAGYGEFSPAVANDTPENRAKNRRIEIALIPALDEMVKPAPER
ncbi:MAG: OmpA family protein [Polyangiaceae bacterium]|nr:OmpA family protein [Polyangiaceae bacterium]